jgi:hypothetical protein
MNYFFHPEAEEELLSTIRYYHDCQEGLGDDFFYEAQAAIQRILDFPKAWPILEKEVRRCLLNRFPYGILYSIEPDRIFIIAVMSLKLNPGYWEHRI